MPHYQRVFRLLLIAAFIVPAFLLLAPSHPAHAQGGVAAVVALDNARLRAAPSSSAVVLALFPLNSSVTAIRRDFSGEWVLVTSSYGFTGWMSRAVLRIDLAAIGTLPIELNVVAGPAPIVPNAAAVGYVPSPATAYAAPAVAAPAPAVALPVAPGALGGPFPYPALRTQMATTQDVWLRAAPDLGSERFTVIPGNTPLQIIELTADYQWAHVRYWVREGWVALRYLQ